MNQIKTTHHYWKWLENSPIVTSTSKIMKTIDSGP